VVRPDKDGRTRVHVQQVESGVMFDDQVVILAGLSAGERVAASGSFKLREGVLVVSAGEQEHGPQPDQLLSKH
jgi:membrane fusion protein (multidrug efflux system)